MWFFIAEGFYHTRSVKKYAKKLFTLAFISHFAYNFCFGIPFVPFKTGIFNQTSILWSLAWGLVLLWLMENPKILSWQKYIGLIVICLITFPSDWSCIASLAILFIGTNRGNFKAQMLWMMVWTIAYATVYYFFIDKTYAVIQLCTCLSIPLLRIYNGQRGNWKGMRKLFYIYYPAHLIICGILRTIL